MVSSCDSCFPEETDLFIISFNFLSCSRIMASERLPEVNLDLVTRFSKFRHPYLVEFGDKITKFSKPNLILSTWCVPPGTGDGVVMKDKDPGAGRQRACLLFMLRPKLGGPPPPPPPLALKFRPRLAPLLALAKLKSDQIR